MRRRTRQLSARTARLVTAGLAVVAVILAVVCGVTVVHTRSFVAGSRTTTGEVLELVPRRGCTRGDCSTTYAPRIRFTSAAGQQREFTSAVSSSPAAYAPGDPVPVRYRIDDPADARVDSLVGLWLASLITGAIAVFFAAFALLFLLIGRRRPRTAPVEPDHPSGTVDQDPLNPYR